jgi:two-component system sensor histidine kinase ChiS
VINILSFQSDVKKLKLISKISNSLQNSFNSDENRVKQILINLVSNAIKYTREGFVMIKAERCTYHDE